MEFPLEISQGETFILPMTYKEEDSTIIDLTDYTAKMQIRETPTASTIILELATNGSGITINGSLGEIEIVISDDDTASLPAPFKGTYDLFIVSPDDQVEKILYGTVEIIPSTTRPI